MVCQVALYTAGGWVYAKEVTTNIGSQEKTNEEALTNLKNHWSYITEVCLIRKD